MSFLSSCLSYKFHNMALKPCPAFFAAAQPRYKLIKSAGGWRTSSANTSVLSPALAENSKRTLVKAASRRHFIDPQHHLDWKRSLCPAFNPALPSWPLKSTPGIVGCSNPHCWSLQGTQPRPRVKSGPWISGKQNSSSWMSEVRRRLRETACREKEQNGALMILSIEHKKSYEEGKKPKCKKEICRQWKQGEVSCKE